MCRNGSISGGGGGGGGGELGGFLSCGPPHLTIMDNPFAGGILFLECPDLFQMLVSGCEALHDHAHKSNHLTLKECFLLCWASAWCSRECVSYD